MAGLASAGSAALVCFRLGTENSRCSFVSVNMVTTRDEGPSSLVRLEEGPPSIVVFEDVKRAGVIVSVFVSWGSLAWTQKSSAWVSVILDCSAFLGRPRSAHGKCQSSDKISDVLPE